jgi:hypothetical protein
MHQLLGFFKNRNKIVIFFLLKNFFVLVFKRLITYLDDNRVIQVGYLILKIQYLIFDYLTG